MELPKDGIRETLSLTRDLIDTLRLTESLVIDPKSIDLKALVTESSSNHSRKHHVE